MDNKHTPGPWIVEIGGRMVATEADGDNGYELFDVRGDVPEFEANARLIAAAPELLEACEHALTLLAPFEDDGLSLGLGGQALKKLKSAVAKARGQS